MYADLFFPPWVSAERNLLSENADKIAIAPMDNPRRLGTTSNAICGIAAALLFRPQRRKRAAAPNTDAHVYGEQTMTRSPP